MSSSLVEFQLKPNIRSSLMELQPKQATTEESNTELSVLGICTRHRFLHRYDWLQLVTASRGHRGEFTDIRDPLVNTARQARICVQIHDAMPYLYIKASQGCHLENRDRDTNRTLTGRLACVCSRLRRQIAFGTTRYIAYR